VVPEILIFKERIRDIFIASKSKEEAVNKRNALLQENWKTKSPYFDYALRYLANNYHFNYMTTYLEHPQIPKSGNSETVISVWRQMEAARYGFKSSKGRQDHLKLYQISHYLNEEI
jgi:hypothetical protein